MSVWEWKNYGSQMAHKRNTASIPLKLSMSSIVFESLDQSVGNDKGCLHVKEEKSAVETPFNTCIGSWV